MNAVILKILCSFTAAGWVLFAFGVIQFPLWAFLIMLKKRERTFLEVSSNSNILHGINLIFLRLSLI
jgi:hypothetical protein